MVGPGGPSRIRPGRLAAQAQQVAQHALAHVLQVGRAGGQGGVRQRALRGHALVHRVAPGPGGAVALHHGAAHGLHQFGIAQQPLVGREDAGLLGPAGGFRPGGQLLQLRLRGGEGPVERRGPRRPRK